MLVSLTILTGCATGNVQNKSTQTGQTQSGAINGVVSANAPFRTLYKPLGNYGRYYIAPTNNAPTKQVLLDYSAEAPEAKESSEVRVNCSSVGLVNVVGNQNILQVDLATYKQLEVLGDDIVKRRATWKFNLDQTNKAAQTVPSQYYEQANVAPRPRSDQTNSARPQKQDSGYITRTGRLDSQKITKDILTGLGLQRDPVAERKKAEASSYEEFKRDLDYNRSLLAAQDQQILGMEQTYVNKLSGIYHNALNNLINTPVNSIGTETLKQFSKFRTNNIYECIYERTSSKVSWPSELMNDRSFANSTYEKYASSVVLAGADDAIKKFKTSTTSAGIETEFSYLYPTDDLKRVVFNTPAIASVFKERSAQIRAEEKRKYEELQKRLAAEAIQQAKLKIKNNSLPSESDLLRAVLKASAQETDIAIKNSRTQITSSNTYEQFDNILGYEFKGGEMTVAVKNLNCRKEGGKQKCTYDEVSKQIPFAFGLGLDIRGVESVRRENLFYWTMEGLVADKGVEVVHFNPPSGSRSDFGSGCTPHPGFPGCGVSAGDAIEYSNEIRKIGN